MTKPAIKHIKFFIKSLIIVSVLTAFIVFGFFMRPTHTFENANMKKWSILSESQRVSTINNVVKTPENPELLMNCVNKIAQLPDSEDMIIRDAIVICYNGIKINNVQNEE